MKVDETNAEEFCRVMQPNELSEDELRGLIAKEGVERAEVMFVIDFDYRTYISAYFDYPMEDYAPPGWKSSYGSTLAYLPEQIRTLWQ